MLYFNSQFSFLSCFEFPWLPYAYKKSGPVGFDVLFAAFNKGSIFVCWYPAFESFNLQIAVIF